MKPKTYTLELTAEELCGWRDRAGGCDVLRKVQELANRAKTEREADELRLPWTAELDGVGWALRRAGATVGYHTDCERAAKLASAAPELLEAVQAAKEYLDRRIVVEGTTYWNILRLCERALRKVETGVPE